MTERMTPPNTFASHGAPQRVAALCRRNIFLLGLATEVMSCNRGFAEMSAAHTGPNPEHQRHPNTGDELDRRFGGQFTARKQLPVSGIVTLQDQYSDAERTARRALNLDRTGTHDRLVLGVSLVLQKKFTAEAEHSLRSAAADFPHANFWLATGLLLRGDVASAKDQIKMYLASGEKTGMDRAKALSQELDLVTQSKQ